MAEERASTALGFIDPMAPVRLIRDFTYIILMNTAVKKEEMIYDAGKRRSTPNRGSEPAAG